MALTRKDVQCVYTTPSGVSDEITVPHSDSTAGNSGLLRR